MVYNNNFVCSTFIPPYPKMLFQFFAVHNLNGKEKSCFVDIKFLSVTALVR